MKTFLHNKEETNTKLFFGQSRLVFFANDSTQQGGPGEGDKGKDDDEKTQNIDENNNVVQFPSGEPANSQEKSITPETKSETQEGEPSDSDRGVQKISEETMTRVNPILRTIDMAEVENILPKELIEKVKDDVYSSIGELDKVNKEIDNDLEGFLKELQGDISDKKKLEDDLWFACNSLIPEMNTQNLSRINSSIVPLISQSELTNKVNDVLNKHKLRHPDVSSFVNKILPKLDQVTQHEWKMIGSLMELQKASSEVSELFRKRSYEDNLKEKERRTVGFPLKAGTRLTGLDIADGQYRAINKTERTYVITDVQVDRTVEEDGEKVKYNGVVVKLKDEKEGDEKWYPIAKLKYLVDVMDLVPVAEKGLEDVYAMTQLSDLGVELKEGMTLDYVEIDRNDDGTLNKKTKQVTIESITDEVIKLDQEVIYRMQHTSPHLGSHESKQEFTFPEFIKWFNQRSVIPQIEFSELENKLKWHTEYLNKKYNRIENSVCFEPIELKAGEIIYIDSRSKKLFEIESVNSDTGEIKLKNGETYSPTDFFRWVFENEIEKFDPELEKLKAEKFGGITDEKQLEDIRKKAQDAIKHFQETGEGDDIMRKIEEATKDRREKGEGLTDKEGKPLLEDVMKNSIPMMPTSQGRIGVWWRSLTWLRPSDIVEFFRKCWESYQRKWKRRQSGRYSEIGKNLPYFGSEFEGINQSTENEEVSQYQEAMNNWGIWQIEDVLYTTTNKDQAKACLNVLASKGMIRWDEPKLWATINQFNNDSYQIPFPKGGDAYIPYEKGFRSFPGIGDIGGKTGMDLLPNALDAIWGEGSYNGWFGENKGAIQNGIQRGLDKAKDLEGDPKSLGAAITSELALLMERHLRGEYVDPHEFEGLLRWCFTAGKSSGEGKIYYTLMGLVAKNPQGRTLLTWDRKGTLGSDVMQNFPLIDYFSSGYPKRHPSNPNIIINEPVRKDHFQEMVDNWTNTALYTDNFYPPQQMTDFLNKEMLLDKNFQDRLEKMIRHPENLDHDDANMWIPALKENMVEKACSTITGNKSAFTIPGYRNAYAGYGTRVKFIMERLDEDEGTKHEKYLTNHLIDTILSYVRFDSILWDRLHRRDSKYTRLSESDLDTVPVIDPKNPTRIYKNDMDKFLVHIISAMGENSLATGEEVEKMQLAFAEPGTVDEKKQEEAIKNFRKPFIKAVEKDSKLFRNIIRQYIKSLGKDNFGLRGTVSILEQLQQSAQAQQEIGNMDDERMAA